MMARAWAHCPLWRALPATGPSATTSSIGGLAAAISRNTRSVVSGRLNMMKATGVFSRQSDIPRPSEPACSAVHRSLPLGRDHIVHDIIAFSIFHSPEYEIDYGHERA